MVGAPIGNLNGSRWIDEHDAFLRARLAEGVSTAQAAIDLNKKFGTDYSRNACIGRASRKNMQRDHTHGPKRRKATAEDAPKPARVRQQKLVRVVPAAPVDPEPVTLRCVEIEPRHVSLLDLQPEQCRWPYGDGPFTFCGHPAVFGSYCGPHYGLSVGAGTRSEQAANRVSRKVA